MGIRLFYAHLTRSSRPRWLLEELGVPYELTLIDLAKAEHKTPEHLARHPHGSVPVLEVDGVTMFESAAMITYLADRYPAANLAPATNAPERVHYVQWLFYAAVTAEVPIHAYSRATKLPSDDPARTALFAEASEKLPTVLHTLDTALKGKAYLLGENFSAADVLIGSVLIWANALELLKEHPGLLEYCTRLRSREAWKRAHKRPIN